MANTAPDVEVEETTEDSSPEVTTEEVEPSEEDNSSEETLPTGKASKEKANERIRELIEQRNNLASQLQAEKAQKAPQNDNQFDGVTPDGIDPEKYAASLSSKLINQTTDLTNKQITFQLAVLEVRKDPVMKSKVAQEHVSSLINQGFAPTEALEIYKDDLKTIESELLEKTKARKEATDASRSGTTVTPSGKSSTPGGNYTWAMIDQMPMAQYKSEQTEIKRQAAAGLIK